MSTEAQIRKSYPGVTMVITSHRRPEYLRRTLDSFLATNDFPLEKILIIEDSDDERMLDMPAHFPDAPIEVVLNGENLGQAASIDKAYGLVQTEYIFHCEEDWSFGRGGVIAESIDILEAEPNTIMVMARTRDDLPVFMQSLKVRETGQARYRLIRPQEHHVWFTFSFNPGLRRKSDWAQLPGGYAAFVGKEAGLSQHYKQAGRDMAWLVDGQVRHIGEETTHVTPQKVPFWYKGAVWYHSARRKFRHYGRLAGVFRER